MIAARRSARIKQAQGLLIGVFSLGAMDGWPFGSNLETTKAPLGLFEQDVVVILLIVVLAWFAGRRLMHDILDGVASRAIALWAAALGSWWLYTLIRTYVNTPVTLKHGIFFGRDFLYFPILTLLMSQVLRDRVVRNWTLGAFAVGAVINTGLQIALTLGANRTAHYVHPLTVTPEGGLQRVYASSADAIFAMFFVGVGLTLLATRERERRIGLLLTLITAVGILTELTRAKYLGVAIGVPVSVLLWFLPRGEHRGRGARGLAAFLAIAAIIAIVLVGLGPSRLGRVGANVGARLESSIATAFAPSQAGSTTLTRENELTALEQVLSSHQILGLGFLDPRNVNYVQVPNGSIRNSDVGLFNVVMTMGIIGTVIYILPLFGVGALLIARHARGHIAPEDEPLALAVVGWAIAALVSSLTLVILFHPTGVISAGLMLGCGVAVLDGRPRPAFVASRRRSAPIYAEPSTELGASVA